MAHVNKVCKVCGKQYSYCPSCSSTIKDPLWKSMFCSNSCKSIWEVLSKNGVGHATAQETVDALNKISMPEQLNYNVCKHIDKLKAEVKSVEEPVMQLVEQVKQEEKVDEVQANFSYKQKFAKRNIASEQ